MDDARNAGAILRQFVAFAFVGALGFAVDATIFVALSDLDWTVAGARSVSASCAIAVTWALNRHTTFAARKSPRPSAELLRYAIGQGCGLAVNLGVFALALWSIPLLRRVPVVALALGAGAALVFNFVSARTLAFRGAERRSL